MNKEKHVLSRLKISEVDEVSNVGKPANKLTGFDIVKSDDVEIDDVRKDIEEQYNISSNPMIKSENGKLLINSPTVKAENIEKKDNQKQEKQMEESKIGLLEKFISFLKNDTEQEIIESGVSKEDDIKEDVEKQEDIVAASDVEKQNAQEEVIKEEVADSEEAVEKQEDVEAEDVKKSDEKEAELEKIQKEADESKAKIEDLQKQLETIELEKAEQTVKIEKQELLNIVKSEMEFASGTPEQNTEILFELKKAISPEQYNWIFENFKKQSEKIEKALDSIGEDTKEEPVELTASQKIDKIAKKIEQEEKMPRAKAYRKALDSNPELAKEAYRERN